MTIWKFDRAKGRIDESKSFAMELPPYWQDLFDPGKLVSDGWIFGNSFNTELAVGGVEDGNPPFEAGVSRRDMDYLHIINLKAAEAAFQAGKFTRIKGFPVISLQTSIDEHILYFAPEPKSPHGVDITPKGDFIVVSGKLDPHVTIYSFDKIQQAIADQNWTLDDYGVPVLDFDAVVEKQVEVGLGPLHTQFDDKGYAYVPQELALYDDLTAAQTLRFFARLQKAPRGAERAVLKEVDLATHRPKRVGELSGGMKQRLALGVALLADPPILMLDEPTSNLDAASRDALLGHLLRLKERGKTILFSSHRREEALALADRVVRLRDGRIETVGGVDETGDLCGEERLTLAILVALESRQRARDSLRAAGYDVAMNGSSVLVTTGRRRKAGPIVTLAQAGVEVHDFELRTE